MNPHTDFMEDIEALLSVMARSVPTEWAKPGDIRNAVLTDAIAARKRFPGLVISGQPFDAGRCRAALELLASDTAATGIKARNYRIPDAPVGYGIRRQFRREREV